MAKPKKILKTRISNLYDTETNWEAVQDTAVLEKGEIAVYAANTAKKDYTKFKIGDGETKLSELPFANKLNSITSKNLWSSEDDQQLKVHQFNYNNMEYPIFVPKVSYEVTKTTAISTIGKINVGNSSYEIKETPVVCSPASNEGISIGDVTIGTTKQTFKAPRVVSNSTEFLTVNNSNSDKEVQLTILKDAFIDMMYPVGSIYFSVNSINPGDTTRGVFKYGTWVTWGQGKVPVGVAAETSDVNFGSVEKSGGAVTQTVTGVNKHKHTFTPSGSVSSTFTGSSGTTYDNGSHTHTMDNAGNHQHELYVEGDSGDNDYILGYESNDKQWDASHCSWAGNHTHTIHSGGLHAHGFTPSGSVSSTFTGSSGETDDYEDVAKVSSLQPYITCYMWKRTA